MLVRELSKPGADRSYILGNLIALKVIFSLIIFGLCIGVGFLIPQYDWTLKIGITAIAASWFWMSLNNTYVGLFQSQLEMYKTATSDVIGRAIILGGVIWLVSHNYGLQPILATTIVGNIVNFALNYFWGLKFVKPSFRFDFTFWKILLIQSFPLAILAIVGLVHFKIDTFILSVMKGPVDVGIYGVPYKILEIILVIPAIFIGNIFPIITKYFHTNDPRLDESIQKSFDFLVIIAVPIVTILVVLAWPIIQFIAGHDYLTASTVSFAGLAISAPRVLMILSFAVGVSFFINIFSGILTAINKQNSQIFPMIVITVFNVLLNIIFIGKYSYFASAIITFITEAVMLFWWFYLSKKYLHFKLNFAILSKAIITGLIMALALFYLRSINVILAAAIGLAIYAVIGFLLKLFDKEMIKRILPANFGAKDA